METQQTRRLGRPPKQEARNTRERILDSALDLFAAQGFAGTSLRQIAQAVGVRESAIYAHFESKQAIYETLFAQAGPPTAIVDGLLAARENSGTEIVPAVFLNHLTDTLLATWDEPRARQFASFLMREGVLATAGGNVSVQTAIHQAQQHLGALFTYWLDRGLIKADFPTTFLVWELISPLMNVRLLYLKAENSEEQRQEGRHIARQHIAYFLASVFHETGRL